MNYMQRATFAAHVVQRNALHQIGTSREMRRQQARQRANARAGAHTQPLALIVRKIQPPVSDANTRRETGASYKDARARAVRCGLLRRPGNEVVFFIRSIGFASVRGERFP
jgi:hypothetical protein